MWGQRAGLPDVQQAGLTQLLEKSRHYAGIASDPPDLNFEQLTGLSQRNFINSDSNDPLISRLYELGTQSSNENAILEALLHSIVTKA